MQSRGKGAGPEKESASPQTAQSREAISKLAQSREAQQLMELLQKRGGVQAAARAAAAGDPSRLMEMMNQLMNTKEGAELVDRIGTQAKKAGLDR